MIPLSAIEATNEMMLVDGVAGFNDRVGVFILLGVDCLHDEVGMVTDPPALAHTFAAALLASHPAAVMS